jgi:hypothetical protein
MAYDDQIQYIQQDDVHHKNDILCNAISDAEDFASNTVRFDSYRFSIKIDNCCTETISRFQEDFDPAPMK